MNKIHKIVTARNTAFIENFQMDTAENSPIITDIEFLSGNVGLPSAYYVEFSNGTFVEVKDVVEIWNREATAEEESIITEKLSKVPFCP